MLELKPRGEKTELVFRRRESRFSPDFFKGLLLASFFHFLLFFFLHIVHPSPPDESHLLPFTEVVAEWDLQTAIVQVAPLGPYIASFEESVPEAPPEMFPEMIFSCRREFRREFEPDFSCLEKIPYHPLCEED